MSNTLDLVKNEIYESFCCNLVCITILISSIDVFPHVFSFERTIRTLNVLN